MRKFADIYQSLLDSCMSLGYVETNKRTNTKIRALPQGASFSIYLGNNTIPTCGLRFTKPWHSAAEAAWCFLGHDHINWLKQYLHSWDQFADKGGKLEQAYGARWKESFGFNQLDAAIARLERDPSDRRIWITSYKPDDDLWEEGQKTVPCPVGFSLSVMDGSLGSSLMIRSSDLYFGLPYDVMRHAFVMRAIAATLGIGLGYMRVNLAHPHVYEPQWADVNLMLRMDPMCPLVEMPDAPIDLITKNPDHYVGAVRNWCEARPANQWPEFRGTSKVVK